MLGSFTEPFNWVLTTYLCVCSMRVVDFTSKHKRSSRSTCLCTNHWRVSGSLYQQIGMHRNRMESLSELAVLADWAVVGQEDQRHRLRRHTLWTRQEMSWTRYNDDTHWLPTGYCRLFLFVPLLFERQSGTSCRCICIFFLQRFLKNTARCDFRAQNKPKYVCVRRSVANPTGVLTAFLRQPSWLAAREREKKKQIIRNYTAGIQEGL